MSTVDIIRSLAATNSRTDKEQILIDAWMGGERDFFKGAQLAYDILLPFNIKKVAEIQDDDGTTATTLTMANFLFLAFKLHNRELTGNAARDAVHAAAEKCDAATWNEFYRRILLKDFKAGVSDSTINKVLEKIAKSDADAKKYIVPVWSCQLAKDGNDEANAKKVAGVKMLDIKLDGVRLLTIVDKEARTVTQYTRNGLQNDKFPHIRAAFEQLLDNDMLPASMVFDGEITGKSFQQLMTQVNREKNSDSSDTKLALFDMVPLADFKEGLCKIKQKDRHTALCGMIGVMLNLSGAVYVVPKKTVNLDTKEGYAEFVAFNKEALDAGYEGIMAKDPEAPYECKRTAAWLKLKPFIEVSLTAKAFKYGDKGTKFEKVMGAVLYEGEDDGKQVSVWCGSGYSDKDREEIAKNFDKAHKGFVHEIKADCFSLEQGGTIHSLRFPRYKGPRGFKPGEKL